MTKVYKTGGVERTVLNGIDINFRVSEFAAILGPSGSGKTTLLNIIGGLDKYTTGDLIINEKSTKKFRDKDSVTDVLSFPLGEAGALERHPVTGTVLLGDIVFCAPRAVEQAEEYGHSVQREFGFLCAHSVLHLLGYDHVGSAEEAAVMEMKQHEALESIGLLRE